MSSPASSVSGFFASISRAASPLIDRLKYALSPVSRSAPVSPIVSPTKPRIHRAPKSISSSLREKNKQIEIGKPLQKVYKVPTHIAKKKQPKMAYVKQLKEPKDMNKKKSVNYLDEAFRACKKEGKILEIPKKEEINGTVQNPIEHMDLDKVIKPQSASKPDVSKNRIKLFAPPSLEDDPDYVEKYPFPQITNQPHFGSITEAIHDLSHWTKEHKASREFDF